MKSTELIQRAIEIAAEKKVEDIKVLDVGGNLTITDYFVLITVQNRRQAQAISSAIDYEMKHAGVPKASIEGQQGGWWVLLDYDSVVIHVFQAEARKFYDLDQLWADSADRTEEFAIPARDESPDEVPS